MINTDFYCPECEANGKRVYLATDGSRYRCGQCGHGYSREDLRNSYTAELENLEADANFVRGKMVALDQTRAARKAA